MLSNVLSVLARSNPLTLTQLAQETGYSIREVKGALHQIESMGYIKRELLGKACGSGGSSDCNRSNCQGCVINSSPPLVSWTLTERGKEFNRLSK
ncbi:MAG TPA: winged helix-turn-helix domain-containing protein [Desulfobacteria bacterium]|nr:winged helix-turn-helix domain-containing protein [Desulfobacteria bacterium]